MSGDKSKTYAEDLKTISDALITSYSFKFPVTSILLYLANKVGKTHKIFLTKISQIGMQEYKNAGIHF
jgi:hypothetical protein